MKVTFRFTLITHESIATSFANTPMLQQEINGEWITIQFKETPLISTYLIAYVIANYQYIQKNSDKGILIQVAARPQSIQNGDGDYSLDIASRIIDFFENYFYVAYPLEKSSKPVFLLL